MKNRPSKHDLDKLATAFCTKQTDLLKLIGVSRQYAHTVISGKVFPSDKYLKKIGDFKLIQWQQSQQPKNKRAPIRKFECDLKAGVSMKKLCDVRDKLKSLNQIEEAIQLTERLKETYKAKSLEHDWCIVHVRVLKQKLPKNTEFIRAELEAKEAALLAEIKYWEKRKS